MKPLEVTLGLDVINERLVVIAYNEIISLGEIMLRIEGHPDITYIKQFNVMTETFSEDGVAWLRGCGLSKSDAVGCLLAFCKSILHGPDWSEYVH